MVIEHLHSASPVENRFVGPSSKLLYKLSPQTRGVESQDGPRGCRPKRGPWAKIVTFFRKSLQFFGHFRKILVLSPSKILTTFFSHLPQNKNFRNRYTT